MTKLELVAEIIRIFHNTPGNTLIREIDEGVEGTGASSVPAVSRLYDGNLSAKIWMWQMPDCSAMRI